MLNYVANEFVRVGLIHPTHLLISAVVQYALYDIVGMTFDIQCRWIDVPEQRPSGEYIHDVVIIP